MNTKGKTESVERRLAAIKLALKRSLVDLDQIRGGDRSYARLSSKNNKYAWQPEPTELGWYWMRYKPKFARRYFHEMVWTGDMAWAKKRQIRIGSVWKSADGFHRVAFSGPISPPPD